MLCERVKKKKGESGKMLKKTAYINVSKELESMKQAREKFEKQMKEVDELKANMLKVANGMIKAIKLLEQNEEELSFHRKAIIDAMDRLKVLEEKGKPSDDEMYQ